MIIIEGNNKKYIKAVIGLYIVFTIISPIIKNFSSTDFRIDTEKILQGDKTYAVSSEKLDLDTDINKIYNSSLEADIKSRLTERGYDTTNLKLEIDNGNKKIKNMDIKVNPNNSNISNINIKPIQTIGIQPVDKKEELTDTFETEELKNYISNIYDIDKQQISITIER